MTDVGGGASKAHPKTKRLLVWALGGALFFVLILTLFLSSAHYANDWWRERLDLPAPATLYDFRYDEDSEVYAADGRKIACFASPEHRIRIESERDIPPLVERVLLASEDQRFYDHGGVDWIGVARAFGENLVSARKASGASTLSMQLARRLLLKDTTKSYVRKWREANLAIAIEHEFTKRELLLLYVNLPYLGRGQYGFEAASRSYFGRSAADLTLPEVAWLVALVSQPGLVDRMESAAKRGDKQAEKSARDEVMRKARRVVGLTYELHPDLEEKLSLDAAREAIADLKISPVVSGCSTELVGSYYIEEIRKKWKEKLPLNTGGLAIHLPVDAELQRVAERALAAALASYRKRYTFDDPELARRFEKRKSQLRDRLLKEREQLPLSTVSEIEGELAMSFDAWKRAQAEDRDSITGMAYGVDFAGRVRFVVGGEDFKKSKWNIATQGFRQPGSTFKPFAYAALAEEMLMRLRAEQFPESALLNEIERTCTVLDAPIAVSRGRGRPPKWIANFRSNDPNVPYYAGEITCARALAESRNTAAIRAGTRAGVGHMIELAARLGVGTSAQKYPIQRYPTTAIGASDVVPIDLAAYIAFMNGGYRVPAVWENDICERGKKGESWSLIHREHPDPGDASVSVPRVCIPEGAPPKSYERVLDPLVAEFMRSLLLSVVDDPYGTAHSLRKKFPKAQTGEIGGKTGTATNANGDTSDVWFVVLVPGPPGKESDGLMMAFWMGKVTKRSLGPRETGGRNLIPVATEVMQFLRDRRGLLRPDHAFAPIVPETVRDAARPETTVAPVPSEEERVIDPSVPGTEDVGAPPPDPLPAEDGPDEQPKN